MLIAFDVHMIHMRSTYDLHTIYIDYCYDLHGLPARLTPTCLAGPPHARGEGRKNLNCDRLPLYIRPTGAAIRLRHLNSGFPIDWDSRRRNVGVKPDFNHTCTRDHPWGRSRRSLEPPGGIYIYIYIYIYMCVCIYIYIYIYSAMLFGWGQGGLLL